MILSYGGILETSQLSVALSMSISQIGTHDFSYRLSKRLTHSHAQSCVSMHVLSLTIRALINTLKLETFPKK